MGNIDGMRAVLGLFLVSPVVETAPRHGADVHGAAAILRPLRCPPSSAASPPIVMRFGGGDRSDVQANRMILRKEQRNALIVAKSLESFSVFALVSRGSGTGPALTGVIDQGRGFKVGC